MNTAEAFQTYFREFIGKLIEQNKAQYRRRNVTKKIYFIILYLYKAIDTLTETDVEI